MTYEISYEDGRAAATAARDGETTRTESFGTESEALSRARELVESGDHQSVSVCDSSGDVLAGVRLQLKLGASVVD